MFSARTVFTLSLTAVVLAGGAACKGDDSPSASAPSSTATTAATATTVPEATTTTAAPGPTLKAWVVAGQYAREPPTPVPGVSPSR
jgi:hypothetical protein